MSTSPKRFPVGAGDFLGATSKPVAEHQPDLLRFQPQFARVADPEDLDGRCGDRFLQPRVYEIQAEHTQESVEQKYEQSARARCRSRWLEERAS